MVILETRISDITMEQLGSYLFLSMFCLLVVSLVFYGIVKCKRNMEDDAQPVRVENAKVIDKQNAGFEVWVLFETETGKRVRLITKPNDEYIVGDEGCLKWQGTRLYSFERGKRAAPQNKIAQPAVYGAPSISQGYIPAWKRVQMEAEKETQQKADETMKCGFCGAQMQEGQAFCGSCGRSRT